MRENESRKQAQAASFDWAADVYERARPTYPTEAVDPSEQMLAQLRTALPSVDARIGTAESIPLPDDAVDVVLVAQAWHWVDPAIAEPEVARVLRPGGRLGLIWNVRDESVPWVARLTEVMHASAAEIYVADHGRQLPRSFGPVERFSVSWEQPFDRAWLLDLVASRSYFITETPSEQAQMLAAVEHLLDVDPDLGPASDWVMPYRTEAFRMTLPA